MKRKQLILTTLACLISLAMGVLIGTGMNSRGLSATAADYLKDSHEEGQLLTNVNTVMQNDITDMQKAIAVLTEQAEQSSEAARIANEDLKKLQMTEIIDTADSIRVSTQMSLFYGMLSGAVSVSGGVVNTSGQRIKQMENQCNEIKSKVDSIEKLDVKSENYGQDLKKITEQMQQLFDQLRQSQEQVSRCIMQP